MFRTILLGLAVGLLLATSVVAQLPPRYEIVRVDEEPLNNYTARMNNHGQIVYGTWFDGGNTDAIDIFLYDNGETIRLTDDDTFDRTPDINDAGQIVWCRAVEGPGTPTQIVLWEDGELTQLTFDERDDRSPRINNLGHVVWLRFMGEAPNGAMTMDLFFWDGQEVAQFTSTGEDSDGIANQTAVINDLDEVVWTEYDFSQNPWRSRIMLYSDGFTQQVSPNWQTEPQGPNMNNCGLVTWKHDGIWMWEDGVVSLLTDWGGGAKPNDRGDIALSRTYDADPVPASELWLYRNGEFYQITDNPHDQGWYNWWIGPTDINNKGEVVFIKGRPWFYEDYIYRLKLRLGGRDSPTKIDPTEVRPVAP